MKCSSCGNELAESAKFCNKCGTPVASSQPQNNEASVADNTPQQPVSPVQTPVQPVSPNQSNGQAPNQQIPPMQPNGQAPNQQIPPMQPNGQTPNQQIPPMQPNGQAPSQQIPPMQPNGQAPTPAAPKKPINPLIFVAIGAAFLLFIIIIICVANKKTNVKLDKYITVEFSGYDTVGNAVVNFDRESFIDDYEKKIKFSRKFKKSDEYEAYEFWYGSLEDYAAELLLSEFVSYELSDNSGLSNGDVVTVTWDCEDEDVKEAFKAKLKYSELEFTVSGLEKAEIVNPFDCIVVNYSGMAPNGYVEATYNGPLSGIRFVTDNNSCYSNGDTVTFKVQYDYDYGTESSLVNQGVILAEVEKDFTVEGLSSYAMSMDEISGDTFEEMKKQAQDVFLSESAKWDECWTVTSSSYAGMYFLSSKSESSTMNRVTIIHKITADLNTTTNDGDEVKDTVTYYYPVTFYNCVVLPDGTLSVDTTNYDRPWESFTKSYDLGGWWDQNYSFNGYESSTTLFNQLVTYYVENYNYETAFEE